MVCPNCQSENRDKAKFCDNCGASLKLSCPNCGSENQPGAKFCDNCGHDLITAAKPGAGQPASAAHPDLLDKFIPPELASKLEAARRRGSMAGERRVVTMLFCDIVGSTAASEQLDPEEWLEIMNSAFKYLITPIFLYEGTVARLMGDAILAFFGAPIAHEDDPQRAILAGLDVVRGVTQYRKDVQSKWGIELNVRVGINTGLVVVGTVGTDLRLEYTAMGDAINLAARMEQTAEPGTVQIAEETYRLAAPLFDTEPIGGITVKGKTDPILSYRVIGQKVSRGRLRGIEGLDAPLIGREEEVEMLRSAMHALQQGAGGIISLVGEAGLGKSRLLQEFKSLYRDQPGDVLWIETHSYSYETEQPYALFQRLIRHLVGSAAGDSQVALRERLSLFVNELPNEKQEGLRQVFESLFGLDSEEGDPPLVGEAFRGQLYTMMPILWRYQSERSPVIMVIEDLHWSDLASVALLKHLTPLCEHAPLLWLFVLRPDRNVPGWELKRAAAEEFPQNYKEIVLHPLSYERSGFLVDSLLQVSNLPRQLRVRILEKSEGNPFFVEEVVRSLIDQGVIVRNEGRWQATSEGQGIVIPDNLRGLLVARMDQLAVDAQRTLQMASVIGRSFHYRVLARIVETVETLDRQLLTLQQADMIREAARMPELAYIFRHALTQDAAYSTLLRKQRRLYHRQVGEVLEALFPHLVDELAGELARHFYQARDFERALRYFTSAGAKAFRLHAAAEAIGHYRRAIDCSKRIEVPSDQLVQLYLRLGRSFELDNQFVNAISTYQEMVQLAGDRGDEALKLASLTAQCIIYATQTPLYDITRAKELGEQALALAEDLNDQEVEAKVLWGLMMAEYFGSGDMLKTLAYGQRSLEIARKLGLVEQMGYTLTNLLGVYLNLEDLEAAREAGQEARKIWRQQGNTPMLADGYNMAFWVEMGAGDFDAALRMGLEGKRLGQSYGGIWGQAGALNSMSAAYLEKGDLGQALGSISEAWGLAKKAEMRPLVYFSLPYLVLAYLTVGAFERAEQYADQMYAERDSLIQVYRRMSLAITAVVKIRTGQLELAQSIMTEASEGLDLDAPLFDIRRFLLTDADLHLSLANPQLALERMSHLVNRMRQSGMRQNLSEALLLQGKALMALDEKESGWAAFIEANRVASETGTRRIHWKILWELSQLEAAAGNTSDAELYRQQAQKIVTFIADHTGSEELQASFLSITEVQSLMAY